MLLGGANYHNWRLFFLLRWVDMTTARYTPSLHAAHAAHTLHPLHPLHPALPVRLRGWRRGRAAARKAGATLIGATLIAVSGHAVAADTADLAVTGMIRPSACNILLSGNGQVDYGVISGPHLAKQTKITSLGIHNVNLLISCDVATRVGFTITDNRVGTASLPSSGVYGFGLGLVGGKKLGAYLVTMLNPVTSDQGTVHIVSSSDKGKTWDAPPLRALRPDGGVLQSWATSSGQAPAAYRSVTQPLKVEAFVLPAADLPPLDAPVHLDGSATFSLVYL